MSKDVIMEKSAEVSDRWESTTTVPNTHNIHQVKCIGEYHLKVYEVSGGDIPGKLVEIIENDDDDDDDDEKDNPDNDNKEDESISMDVVEEGDHDEIMIDVGDWVQVTYNKEKFPGEVTNIIQDDSFPIYISVMHRSSKFWKWPEFGKDEIAYAFEDVVKKIDPPTVAESRGQFSFVDIL